MGTDKFLLFVDDENDIAMYPVASLKAVTCAADEAVLLRFNSGVEPEGGTAAANDLVTLTTTAGAAVEKSIFEAIARACTATGSMKDGLITVCDDINGIFLHKDILSCAITLDTLLLRLTAQDLREMNILKYYRLTRKWACKTYGILDADLELLFYLDCEERFTRKDFMDGTYTYSWDKARWDRLRQDGWIDVWRHRNRTTIKYSVYKTSYRCKQLINRIYRILLGEEDMPTSERSIFYNNKSYTDKVYNKAIDDMIKDKNR